MALPQENVTEIRRLLGLGDEEGNNDTVMEAVRQRLAAPPPPPPPQPPRVNTWAPRLPLPSYHGHADEKTPNEFLSELERFGVAQNIEPNDVVLRVVPVALTGAAQRWWEFMGGFTEWTLFKEALQTEFGSVNYTTLLKRELDARSQHPAEPLSAYVQAIAGYYDRIGERVDEATKLKRVLDQMHPEFRRFIRGHTYTSLRELVEAGPQIQAEILRDRLYRPPPPADWSIERSLAWQDHNRPVTAMTTATASFIPQQPTEINTDYRQLDYAALDPFMNTHIPAWAPFCRGQRTKVEHPTAGPTHNNSGRRDEDNACWNCGDKSHFKRNCKQRVAPSSGQSKN